MKTSRKPKKFAARKRATAAKAPKKAQKPARGKKPSGGRATAWRVDFGAPIDGFFAEQPSHLRIILEELRKLVEKAAPDATASLKWGMPCYSIGGEMMCALSALTGHKSHVNLVLSGPPGTFADPDGLLEGEGKTGRHLQLRTIDELPRDAVSGWLCRAAQVARTNVTRS